MAVKLRLRREGTTKKPHYRVVVADSRSPRDGRFIEIIGHYHPMQEPSGIEINGERALYWLKNGAQPTEQVQQLLRITGVWEEFKPGDQPKRERTEKAKLSKKAREKAAEKAEAAEQPTPEPEPEPEVAAEPEAEAPAPEPEPEADAAAEPEPEPEAEAEPEPEAAPEPAAADEAAAEPEASADADDETTEEPSE